jgi:hypothetical protein
VETLAARFRAKIHEPREFFSRVFKTSNGAALVPYRSVSVDQLFVQAQRSSAFIDSKPQLVQKSAAEIFLELCDVAANSFGMSRAEFLTKYPEQYGRYNKLVTGDY